MPDGSAILKTVGFDEVFCSTAEGWRVRADMASVFRQNFEIPDNVLDFQILYKLEGLNRFLLEFEDGTVQRKHYIDVSASFCHANSKNWNSHLLSSTLFIHVDTTDCILVDFWTTENLPLHKLKFAVTS